MKKFKGKNPIEAIQMIKDEEQEEKERIAALPKCIKCNKPIHFTLFNGQPMNECNACFK